MVALRESKRGRRLNNARAQSHWILSSDRGVFDQKPLRRDPSRVRVVTPRHQKPQYRTTLALDVAAHRVLDRSNAQHRDDHRSRTRHILREACPFRFESPGLSLSGKFFELPAELTSH